MNNFYLNHPLIKLAGFLPPFKYQELIKKIYGPNGLIKKKDLIGGGIGLLGGAYLGNQAFNMSLPNNYNTNNNNNNINQQF